MLGKIPPTAVAHSSAARPSPNVAVAHRDQDSPEPQPSYSAPTAPGRHPKSDKRRLSHHVLSPTPSCSHNRTDLARRHQTGSSIRLGWPRPAATRRIHGASCSPVVTKLLPQPGQAPNDCHVGVAIFVARSPALQLGTSFRSGNSLTCRPTPDIDRRPR